MDGKNYGQKVNPSLKFERVFIKCTYAIAYAYPRYHVNERIRTYSKKSIRELNFDSKYRVNFQKRYFDLEYLEQNGHEYTVQEGQIGILTGEYVIDNYSKRNQVWLRAHLLYCDRANYGWFRSTDILPDVTNELFKGNTNIQSPQTSKTKTKWLWWVAALMALIS
ncbi:MAG: hypothetical protein GX962_13455 [Epulopiscium sp.]|nr:hypothetical protein [Candidatus Epulonipiscium sp.]